ncbi:MAG: extracellular solute-binding protein [Lachnospiraceae bacterium]|nr:extracellular solute-binding protein [Lachnospiraceae bacterium]
MKKKRDRIKRIILALVVVLIIGIFIAVRTHSSKSDAELRAQILSEEWDFSGEDPDSYKAYIEKLAKQDVISDKGSEILLNARDYKALSGDAAAAPSENGLITYADGTVTYEFDVPASGTYYIEVGYTPVADGTMAIVRNVFINDKLPFAGAAGITFDRMWVDESKGFLMQTDRNQGFPSQVQNPSATFTRLESADRSVTGPFLFYFEKGKNTLAFEAVQSTLELSYIKLVPSAGVRSYEEYMALYAGAEKVEGSALTEKGMNIVQAEDTLYKSTSTLLPQNDRTSAATQPHHSSNIVLNTIGGSSWNQAGTAITWKVSVPKAGLYRIATRFMQAENRDFFSAREIKINGELPFAEASSIPFNYKSKFRVDYLGNGEEPYYFYLNEGENTISMTVTLGTLSYAAEQTRISVKNFNDLYRELTAVMGSTPDTFRDYDILSSVPDMVDIMKREYVRLSGVMDSLGDTLENNTKTTEITKLLLQLEKIIKKPDKIAKEFSAFSDNITAIAQWMLDLDKQPLQLDYIMICGEGAKLPKAEAGFFKQTGHKFLGFIGSFTNDYQITGEQNTDTDKKIVVWISTGTRDQYDIVQRMINNAFKDAPFNVELKMVAGGTVMPATLTGNGPDVAIQLDFSMPTNFAYRSAGYDLRQFPDFDEVAKRFAPGAMEYFEYNGGIYALPDEMSFPVMFVRNDILESLGLSVPNTWNELMSMLPYLQSDNMSVFFSSGTSLLGSGTMTSSTPVPLFFASKLYQNGVELYRNNGAEVNLDNLTAELVFKEWTQYYTKQNFQLSISTVTRFRTGEVPIIIDDYTFINTLSAAAPEIEGAWSIYPIPATVREDGTFDRSTACIVGSCMIVKTSVEQNDTVNEAWEFIKWWTDEEVQIQYAEEQMSLLGAAAEFPVANLGAIRQRSKTKGTTETIDEVLRWIRGVPQVPGGYITGREIRNAFLEVIDGYLDPVDTLFMRLDAINNELTTKREEFGLETE